jgi:hypothetical protein
MNQHAHQEHAPLAVAVGDGSGRQAEHGGADADRGRHLPELSDVHVQV